MKKYCEGCSIVFDGERCPHCGGKSKRGPEPDDMCFLVEKEQIWSPMLQDVFDQNGIPYFCKNVQGAAMSLKVGPMSERVLFFVLYKDVGRASDIVAELFSNDGGED
jgi:hypothetical protein